MGSLDRISMSKGVGDSSDFIENFLKKRNLLETDLQVDSYVDNEVISLKAESLGNDYQSFYLDKVDDDLVLMASNTNALIKGVSLIISSILNLC